MPEEILCNPVHKWNGEIIVVDAAKQEVQYPGIVGKPCDCGKMLWDEGMCGPCGQKTWGSKPIENMNK